MIWEIWEIWDEKATEQHDVIWIIEERADECVYYNSYSCGGVMCGVSLYYHAARV